MPPTVGTFKDLSPGSMQVLEGLQQLVDQAGGRTVKRFIKQRALDKAVQDIRGQRAVQTAQSESPSSTDPRLVSPHVLSKISTKSREASSLPCSMLIGFLTASQGKAIGSS